MSSARPSSLRDYAQILRRRKWIVVAIIVLIPAAAVALSLQQEPSFRATAEVLLNRQDWLGRESLLALVRGWAGRARRLGHRRLHRTFDDAFGSAEWFSWARAG